MGVAPSRRCSSPRVRTILNVIEINDDGDTKLWIALLPVVAGEGVQAIASRVHILLMAAAETMNRRQEWSILTVAVFNWIFRMDIGMHWEEMRQEFGTARV